MFNSTSGLMKICSFCERSFYTINNCYGDIDSCSFYIEVHGRSHVTFNQLVFYASSLTSWSDYVRSLHCSLLGYNLNTYYLLGNDQI